MHGKIAKRAVVLFKKGGYEVKAITIMIDLERVNCDLDFQQLLDADDGNFMHDVGGIRAHINCHTGELEDCFWPRYAKKGA